MDASKPSQPTGAVLCDLCRHQRVVANTRGSSYSLCERSRTEPAYPRYPRIPVLECPGFEPRSECADRDASRSERQSGL